MYFDLNLSTPSGTPPLINSKLAAARGVLPPRRPLSTGVRKKINQKQHPKIKNISDNKSRKAGPKIIATSSATTTDTQISTGNSTIKDYESITENGVCEFRVRNIKKNGQRMTQNELYSAQELLNNQKNQVTETNKDNTQLYSTGLYSKNVFALIPLELTKLIEEKDREIARLTEKLCQCAA